MTKITLSNVADLTQTTTAANTINSNSAIIQAAFDNTLSRDGTQPDTMGSNLDMNSFQIINLPIPATAGSPVRLQDVQAGGTITNIPAGGNTGDALVKNSNSNYDVKWTSDSNTVAAGTNILVTGTSPATVSTKANPVFSTSVTTPLLINTGTLTLPTVTDTLVARTTTDTLTNKTFNTAGTGNVFQINGTTIAANTGTGNNVLSTSPTIVTPVISSIVNTGTLTLPTSSDTIVGRATTDTLTNKTFDSAGAGNVLRVNGTTLNAVTGSNNTVVLSSSPTLVTPTLGSATATQITFSPTTGGIVGTSTNDSATAGFVGEYIESVIPSGSAVSLTNGSSSNITSITLAAGDWDIDASTYFITNTTTSITALLSSLSTTTAVLDQTAGRWAKFVTPAFVPGAAATSFSQSIPPYRFSLSGSTTIFLVANTAFTASTLTGWGLLRARRVR